MGTLRRSPPDEPRHDVLELFLVHGAEVQHLSRESQHLALVRDPKVTFFVAKINRTTSRSWASSSTPAR
jgi:hypothetical protein